MAKSALDMDGLSLDDLKLLLLQALEEISALKLENAALREENARLKGLQGKPDTLGLLVGLVVHAADIQDRDGAPEVLKSIRQRFPRLRHVFADAAYAGPKLEAALEDIGKWTLEIIRRSDTAQGFEILPRRWVVERTFAWLNRCRRLAKDWEKTIASAQAWILIANIRLLTRRLARHCYPI